jgi:hypothetical protein
MTTIEVRGNCGDCSVTPGTPHIDGCDVARCTACGYQRIGCDHGGSSTGWGQLWTGIWPGDIEVAMYGYDSLNDVMRNAVWSRKHQLWLKGSTQ